MTVATSMTGNLDDAPAPTLRQTVKWFLSDLLNALMYQPMSLFHTIYRRVALAIGLPVRRIPIDEAILREMGHSLTRQYRLTMEDIADGYLPEDDEPNVGVRMWWCFARRCEDVGIAQAIAEVEQEYAKHGSKTYQRIVYHGLMMEAYGWWEDTDVPLFVPEGPFAKVPLHAFGPARKLRLRTRKQVSYERA